MNNNIARLLLGNNIKTTIKAFNMTKFNNPGRWVIPLTEAPFIREDIDLFTDIKNYVCHRVIHFEDNEKYKYLALFYFNKCTDFDIYTNGMKLGKYINNQNVNKIFYTYYNKYEPDIELDLGSNELSKY